MRDRIFKRLMPTVCPISPVGEWYDTDKWAQPTLQIDIYKDGTVELWDWHSGKHVDHISF